MYMNQQLSKEEYESKVQQLLRDVAFRKEQFEVFRTTIFKKHPNNLIVSSENCTGYNIMSSSNLKDCRNCFYANDVSY